MNKGSYSKLFIILCSINISCLLASNIITVKTISVLGLIFTAGDILFPMTYILNDVFTEVYGFNKSKFVIWISFFCNLLVVTIFEIAILLPSSSSFANQSDFVNILGITPRILVASFASFLVGNFANSIVLSKIKVKTNGKYLALRTIVSTLIGEGLDTIIFIPTAFIGILELKEIGFLVLNTYILKVMLEIILTPITYKVVKFVKTKENIDVYDNEIKYRIWG